MSERVIAEVRDLHQKYGRFPAVGGISFQVRHGEVFALLGTNGAGKTTTMDALAGFRRPTGGSVQVFGVDPYTHRRTIAPRIGVLLQEAGFFEGLTVTETIRAWRRFVPEARPAAEALELVGLAAHARTQVGRLSGGERRRLDLALGLLGRPELLFLDEPTTGLDPEARRRTWLLLRDLVAEGMTVVLTTHYMEEAEFLADRVAIMDHGRIMRQGTVADVTTPVGGRISFRLPDGLESADLPLDERVGVERSAARTVLTAPAPQRALLDLLTWADANGIELSELEVRKGSLEDAFLDVAASGRRER
jgi:ABC-2 type transport system ATP-binding protein